jgi:hypothetical protein
MPQKSDRYRISAESFLRSDGLFIVHVKLTFRIKPGASGWEEARFDAGLQFRQAVEKHLDRGEQINASRFLLMENDGYSGLKMTSGDFAERKAEREREASRYLVAILKQAKHLKRNR